MTSGTHMIRISICVYHRYSMTDIVDNYMCMTMSLVGGRSPEVGEASG